MKLSVSIMMHPSRGANKSYLFNHLGKVPVAMDEKNHIWDTCRRAWLLHHPKAEYHVVIQDDAIIGSNFRERAEKYLTEDAVYVFYLGRPKMAAAVKAAKKHGRDRIVTRTIRNEVAVCLPTHRIKDMVDFCDKRNALTDKHINVWANLRGLKVIYPMPSLVDHRDGKGLHNLNRGWYRRRATWFVDDPEIRNHFEKV